MPLRLEGDEKPDGVVEVYLPYAPVAAAIAEDSRRLYLLLALGFVLLYATLFRIVAVASRRLRHQALHDDLTDLPNRALLYDRMEAALTAAERSGEPAALLLVDLDRFKEVNDTLGHDSGDRLLEEVAARLQGVVRRGDTLARLGGDEFAVLLRGLPDRGMAAELAGRLQDAIARPFLLNGVSAVLDASIGIAHCPEHGTDVHTLVQRADVAMYDAKRSRTSIETYSPDRDPYSAERLQLLGELRAAIGAGELVLHFQPKVDVPTQRVIGVEALVRWQHPVHGLLAAGRVRAAGRAHRRDRRPHALGARQRARAGARLARRGPRPDDGGQPRRAQHRRRDAARRRRRAARAPRRAGRDGSSARSPSTP